MGAKRTQWNDTSLIKAIKSMGNHRFILDKKGNITLLSGLAFGLFMTMSFFMLRTSSQSSQGASVQQSIDSASMAYLVEYLRKEDKEKAIKVGERYLKANLNEKTFQKQVVAFN
jgi:Flp pilus assembly protein TadG